MYFREWRDHRDLTQEEAAARIGMDRSNIARIESGETPYTEKHLDAMARAYGCTPIDLLARHPDELEGPWAIWSQLRAEQRAMLAAVARVMREQADQQA